ncbi:MAG: hypothetical protein QOE10_1313 [Gaiellales bacterium]|nr:hypothetical protein [Gaiellales bacterium]
MEPARAYTRFVQLVFGLTVSTLSGDEARCLRDAADARLFDDDDSDLHDANAECLLLLLETSRRLPLAELEDVRSALEAIGPVIFRRHAA